MSKTREEELRDLALRCRDLLGVECPPGGADELEAIDREMIRLGLKNPQRRCCDCRFWVRDFDNGQPRLSQPQIETVWDVLGAAAVEEQKARGNGLCARVFLLSGFVPIYFGKNRVEVAITSPEFYCPGFESCGGTL